VAPLTFYVKQQQDMQTITAVLLVAAKVSALGLLPIVCLGYLFFLGSHSLLTHLYVAAALLGLVLTITASPRTYRALRLVHGASALAAIPLGLWKVHEHLSFFEGPEYGAAGMTGGAVAAIVVGFLCSRHLSIGGSAHV